MCRWGCTTTNTTYQCKWCGTRFCKECQRGDFTGLMMEEGRCRRCNQRRCQGVRVEYVPRPPGEEGEEKKKGGKGSKGASASSRGRSKSPAKKGGKSGKKSGGKKEGKKGGKKGGKKKKKKKRGES